MAEPRVLLSFLVASFVLIVVPGPSILFVISRGVALGRRAALLTVLGNAAGAYVQVVAVALGVGSLIERSAALFAVVRLAGAAYLVYLGVQAIRHRRKLATVLDVGAVAEDRRNLLGEGFVVGVTNPKLIVFFTAVLPQFVDPHGAPAAVQMLLLGGLWVAVALASDSVWGLVAGSARAWLARSPRRLERLGGTGGLVMIGLGLRVATTGRRD
ncbi:MAG TPA: LysE family translocator [Acidimicrobiales bacterium]